MRAILLICGLILVGGIAAGVWWTMRPTHVGAAFTVTTLTPVAEVVAKPEAFVGRDLRLHGRIARQCPASGHWFYLKLPDGQPSDLRIEMPEDAQVPQCVGRTVETEGRLVKKGDGWMIEASAIEIRKGN